MQRALPILFVLAFATPGCALFAPAPVLARASDAGCSTLIDPAWKEGVPSAEPPAGDTVGDWIAFGDAQTGRLDVANDRTEAVIGITERCEKRDVAALKRATRRKFLGIL